MFMRTIDAVDPAISAVRCLNPRALDQARLADGAPEPQRGALHGVPILLKDNIDVEGLPTTSGCVALASALPKADAPVVGALKAAGAIILGKTNLSEFSFEIRSRSSIGGDVLNPFNPSVTAGGSSGGAAAAVASGFAAAAIGTDTGGSIRTPAAYNGLIGLRPTWGRIDMAGVAPLAPSTDTLGVLARTVPDARLLLGVLVGQDAKPRPLDLETARLGVLHQAIGFDAEVRAALDQALASLRAAGATLIEPVVLPEDVLPVARDHIVDWEFASAFDRYLATNFQPGPPASLAAIIASGDYLEEYEPTLLARASNRDLQGDTYQGILAFHRRLTHALQALFDQHRLDALLYPTSAVVPTSLANPRGGWAPELAACSGRPAISLPVGQAKSGVPIGLELLGHAGEDFALLAVAEAVDAVAGRRFTPDLDALARQATSGGRRA